MQPSETTLTFDLGNEAFVKYIDLGEVTSIVDRRLHRQGQLWAVGGVTLYSPLLVAPGDNTSVEISTIPNTWCVHNSWVKSFKLWKEMRDTVLDDNPSVAGRWSDFKIFMDTAHANSASFDPGAGSWSTNMYPEDSGGNVALLTYRDWEYSEVTMPQHDVDPATGLPDAALNYSLHMLGSDVPPAASYIDGSFAMVEGYENSRAVVQDAPDVPAGMNTGWMTLISDDGSQEPELAQQIEDENDRPPYNRTGMPGSAGNLPEPSFATLGVCSGANFISHMGAFVAPCGLLKVKYDGTVASKLLIHLVPGNSRGLLAERMGQ